MTSWVAERVGDAPIIVPDMDDRMGANINGPSLVRVPDWVQERLGASWGAIIRSDRDLTALTRVGPTSAALLPI